MDEIKTPIPPKTGSGIQSFIRALNFYQCEFIKKKSKKITGSFRFKVINSPIYSIQREIIK